MPTALEQPIPRPVANNNNHIAAINNAIIQKAQNNGSSQPPQNTTLHGNHHHHHRPFPTNTPDPNPTVPSTPRPMSTSSIPLSSPSPHHGNVTVNGAGLWANFTRTFKTPIMAMLDILDNAVDAGSSSISQDENDDDEMNDEEEEEAVVGNGGANININAAGGDGESEEGSLLNAVAASIHRAKEDKDYGDKESEETFFSKIHIDHDHYDNDEETLDQVLLSQRSDGNNSIGSNANSSGIVIRNNSFQRISDINSILTVFKSAKGNAHSSIGENGVGLKQGCAAIADLSFVLIRNEDQLSFGVIAKRLQREDASPLFPRFVLNPNPSQDGGGYDRDHVTKEMERICTLDPEVAICISEYGQNSKHVGIERIVAHYETMSTHPTWSTNKFIFTLIIDQIRHKAVPGALDTNIHFSQETHPSNQQDEHSNHNTTKLFDGLLEELKSQLPKSYLHINNSSDIRIKNQKIHFKYWQQRLVELTYMRQTISKSLPFSEVSDLKNPGGDSYPLRIFCGFDPTRVGDSTLNHALSLHVYSRQTGRRVFELEDARSELKLNSSGTHFCQGLTVVIDDEYGHLTLNPRKDDIAFGEEEHPHIHKDNLFRWVGCISKAYWNLHVQKFPKTSMKGDLSAYIRKHYYPLTQKESFLVDPDTLPYLSNGDFNNLTGVHTWSWDARRGLTSRRLPSISPVNGKDTVMRINVKAPPPVSRPSGRRKAASVMERQPKRARRSGLYEDEVEEVVSSGNAGMVNGDDMDVIETNIVSSGQRLSSRGRVISAPSFFSEAASDEDDVPDRVSSSTITTTTSAASRRKKEQHIAKPNEDMELQLNAALKEIDDLKEGNKKELEKSVNTIEKLIAENLKMKEKYVKLKGKYADLKTLFREERETYMGSQNGVDNSAVNEENDALKRENDALTKRLNAIMGMAKG